MVLKTSSYGTMVFREKIYLISFDMLVLSPTRNFPANLKMMQICFQW
jgi:hypothetical protein